MTSIEQILRSEGRRAPWTSGPMQNHQVPQQVAQHQNQHSLHYQQQQAQHQQQQEERLREDLRRLFGVGGDEMSGDELVVGQLTRDMSAEQVSRMLRLTRHRFQQQGTAVSSSTVDLNNFDQLSVNSSPRHNPNYHQHHQQYHPFQPQQQQQGSRHGRSRSIPCVVGGGQQPQQQQQQFERSVVMRAPRSSRENLSYRYDESVSLSGNMQKI